jgi:hypothetical protein
MAGTDLVDAESITPPGVAVPQHLIVRDDVGMLIERYPQVVGTGPG